MWRKLQIKQIHTAIPVDDLCIFESQIKLKFETKKYKIFEDFGFQIRSYWPTGVANPKDDIVTAPVPKMNDTELGQFVAERAASNAVLVYATEK